MQNQLAAWGDPAGFGGRPRRRRLHRRTWRQCWKRLMRQWMTVVSSMVLVGCSAMPGSGGKSYELSWTPWDTEQRDPIAVLQEDLLDNDHRCHAYRRLGNVDGMNPKQKQIARDYILAQWESETADIARAQAISSLTKFEGLEVENAYHKALKDSSPLVRREACLALGNTTAGAALDELGQIAKDDDSKEVRIAAVQSLGKLGTPKSAHYLAYALRDKDIVVAKTAHEGLKKQTKADLELDYHVWANYLEKGTPAKPAANLANLPQGASTLR